MRWRIQPSTIDGSLTVPGDKSISHRALMLSGLAAGESTIENLPEGEDVRATATCMRELGVAVDVSETGAVVRSSGELTSPGGPLDTANSGTSMRLLAGILAGQPFDSCLVGDASLSQRPMGRVIEPLTRMGARIRSHEGTAPLNIRGGGLEGVTYRSPVASAQVKSAVLLAGLFASGVTSIIESVPTRDHTERMLSALGIPVGRDGDVISVASSRPRPMQIRVPGDPSSAAFFLAAAALTGGEVEIRDLCVNPTRTGFLRALERMGTTVHIGPERESAGEPVANVRVTGDINAPLTIEADDVPSLVDEIPLLVLLATQAPGTSVVRGASELRVKESDRIAAVTDALKRMGGRVSAMADGFVVEGPVGLHGTCVSSVGDHRLAMMLAIAGTIATGTTIVEHAEAASVSFPTFEQAFTAVGGRLERA